MSAAGSAAGGGRRRRWRRFADAWRALALLGLNLVVALLLANLAAGVALWFRLDAPGPLRYGQEKLSRVYPGRGPAEIEELLRETWQREYVYSPFVQHREAPARGRFVNVAPQGFRRSADQGPWPPSPESLNIFVFGGSTTFGYGVADDETVPSRLQQALARPACGGSVRVYNFGRGNYYSEQERVLFEDLLLAGVVPQVALFIDGLNEWKEEPKFSARLSYLMGESEGRRAARALKNLPAIELLRWLRGDRSADGGAGAGDGERRLAELAVDRWLRGRRLVEAVAAEFGVLPLFVWQPVPTWEYRLESHLFAAEAAQSLARHGPLRLGYEMMDGLRAAAPELQEGSNFLWLADLQRGRTEPLYVDAAHYTVAFSEEIAGRIAGFVSRTAPCAAAAG